jgi:hypothetical protein
MADAIDTLIQRLQTVEDILKATRKIIAKEIKLRRQAAPVKKGKAK